jgi:hypothetical protein
MSSLDRCNHLVQQLELVVSNRQQLICDANSDVYSIISELINMSGPHSPLNLRFEVLNALTNCIEKYK